jgi:hypothetical protein
MGKKKDELIYYYRKILATIDIEFYRRNVM